MAQLSIFLRFTLPLAKRDQWADRRYVCRLTFVLFSLLIGACAQTELKPELATPQETPVNQLALPQIELPSRLLVLPIVSLLQASEPWHENIQQLLAGELMEAGYDCEMLAADRFLLLRRKALEESGSIYDPAIGEFMPLKDDVYVQSLVKQLAGRTKTDGIVVSQLVLRPVMIRGDTVQWDGETLDLPIIGDPRRLYRLPDTKNTPRGLSLHIAFYRKDGSRLTELYHALSVPFYLDLTQQPPVYQVRRQLFAEESLPELIDNAVTAALENVVDQPGKPSN